MDFFRDLGNNFKNLENKNFVAEFITEITDYLNNFRDKKEDIKIKEEKINNLREEDALYQVVDLSLNGVYLQNTNNNKIFEEIDIQEELKSIISNDYILRYKNGTYIFEEKLTDDFFENMVDINEYKKIQEKFIKESNILKIEPEMRYNILSRMKDYTVLKYKNGEIRVPNPLLPYFLDEQSILYYKNGKFHKDLSK